MKKIGNSFQFRMSLLLLGSAFLFCGLFVLQYGIFGSDVDWLNQHSVLADYFRKRFYATGNLFPDFAWNLGGGQNIYHFSYYGLFSPQILLSYLFPFVKMDLYLMGSNILLYGITVLLFYHWLSGKKMDWEVCVGTSFMFALAAPLLFHFYNQLMFVNYMPFLCLGFMGVDRHLRTKEVRAANGMEKGGKFYAGILFYCRQSGLLVIAVVGIILTSYYFSVGGLIAIGIYAIWEYVMKNSSITVKDFFKEGFCLLLPIVTAILISGFLLIPTACSLSTGRALGAAAWNGMTAVAFIRKMLLPDFTALRFLYVPYGLGLSTLCLVALAGGFLFGRNWRGRVLPGLLLLVLTIPFFGYLLNGGLYNKDKVFIPFLPLICLQTALYMQRGKEQKGGFQVREWLPYGIAAGLILYARHQKSFETYWILVLLEVLVMGALFWQWRQHCKRPWPILASCIILLLSGWAINKERSVMVPVKEYDELTAGELSQAIKETLDADNGIYRMEQYKDGKSNLANINRIHDIRQNLSSVYSSGSNGVYADFRRDVFGLNAAFRNIMMENGSNNPCFLQFMGVKYLEAKEAPAGYQLYRKYGDARIYQAGNAAPLFYVTDRVMGERAYEQLSFPENQTALLKYAVVPEGEGLKEQDSLEKTMGNFRDFVSVPFELPRVLNENISIRKAPGGYTLEVKKSTKIQVAVKSKGSGDELLALSFAVKNLRRDKDMYIRLENQTNRLTSVEHVYANGNTNFHFLVTKKANQNEVTMEFGEGFYLVGDVRAFTGNLPMEGETLYQQPVAADREGLSAYGGDGMTGTVQVTKEGYFITSIPFDNNFTILVDGQKTVPLRVNTSFLGARIPEGYHTVSMEYHAPGKRAGLAASGAGFLLLGVGFWVRKKIFLAKIDKIERRFLFNWLKLQKK